MISQKVEYLALDKLTLWSESSRGPLSTKARDKEIIDLATFDQVLCENVSAIKPEADELQRSFVTGSGCLKIKVKVTGHWFPHGFGARNKYDVFIIDSLQRLKH